MGIFHYMTTYYTRMEYEKVSQDQVSQRSQSGDVT